MILSAGCSTNDRDSGMLWPVSETDSQFLYHDVILSAGCSIDDRDSGVLMADECEIVLTLSVACLIY